MLENAATFGAATGPKQRQKHYSYDENVDEAAKLIDKESTDIEREAPADGNEPMESVDDSKRQPPAFEE